MPGDLITPLDSNPPDSSLNLAPPAIRNFQIIDNDSLNLQDIIKANGGLMGAYNAMKPQKIILTASEMQQIFPVPDFHIENQEKRKEKIDAFQVMRDTVREQLNKYMYDFGLTNNLLVAQFLGQVNIETNGLQNFEESLNYIQNYDKNHNPLRDPKTGLYAADRIADNYTKVFPYKKDKDGKRIYLTNNPWDYVNNPLALGNFIFKGYWGRGLLQLTWLTNYEGFSTYMKDHYGWSTDFDTPQYRNLIGSKITDAVVSALWFFKTNIIDPSTKWQKFKNSTLKWSHLDYISDDSVTKKINPALLKRFERIDDTYNARQVLYRNSLHPFSFSRFNTPYSSYPFELFAPHGQSIPSHPFQIFTPLGFRYYKYPVPLKIHLNYRNQPYQSPSMFEQFSRHTLMSSYAPHHGAIHQNLIHTTPQAIPPFPQIRRGDFNTTPSGFHSSITPSVTQPVIQNLTINNTTNSTVSRADIQKHVAQLLTAAVSDAHIGTSTQ